MPRKHFISDLEHATASSRDDHIYDIVPGPDDGQFTFFFLDANVTAPFSVTAGVTELYDYPKEHDYFLYAADEAPAALATVLQHGLPSTKGKPIGQLLDIVSSTLSRYSSSSDGDTINPSSQDDELQSEDYDADDADDDDDIFQFEGGSGGAKLHTSTSTTLTSAIYADNPIKFRNRIRSDLRAAKEAGFKVGHHGDLLEGHSAFVSLSIRVVKLGISEEAMQAWQLEPSDYLILLLKYSSGYKTTEQLMGYDFRHLGSNLEMRVCLCKKYKPTLDQAIAAFATSRKSSTTSPAEFDNVHERSSFRETFISKPIQNFLNERLTALLQYREIGMGWNGAEDYYNDTRGCSAPADETIADKYFVPEQSNTAFPAIVTADHRSTNVSQYSFPLIGMQMLLRHFVRCTEFCLVCHRKVDTLVEAIKPFVCSDSLCLYQYISLGFGPSIEHELLAQEHVVDLLISFCYGSASAGKLKDLPTGLALSVPKSFVDEAAAVGYDTHRASHRQSKLSHTKALETPRYSIRIDDSRREMVFEDLEDQSKCPVALGDWVGIELQESGTILHCRVTEVVGYPYVKTGSLINPSDPGNTGKLRNESIQMVTPSAMPNYKPATLERYETNFDTLSINAQRGAVLKLIQCLPSVREMKEYLASQHTPDLKNWVDRISPSALGVLRWIVASNRACIMQVDDPASGAYGMKEWKQFRFAMGAPDKEQRFQTSVRDTTARLSLKFPTLFAWHGSPLENWHSIIREGLNFEQTAHGRAFGHGVYHSLQFHTSLGYSGTSGTGQIQWPNSGLQITTAMALNEIVNASAEFVSKNPHLVVAQLDWIQTRYLFVKCVATNVEANVAIPSSTNALIQDPLMTPTGSSGHGMIIPAKSSKTSKRKLSEVTTPRKRTKGTDKPSNPLILDEDADFKYDGMSDTTDIEDLEILFQEEVIKPSTKISKPDEPQTEFVPGSLDHDTLTQLPTPGYANIGATKRLQSDFRALLKVQESTPPHELGWYIDPEKFDNVYQWIVELHSFHMFNEGNKILPLVTDMKKNKVTSVVLEMRFPGSYPMSPPFVRVIRPRFLPFLSGGGGNVTAGGALCMELLTNTGWTAVSDIASILLQIRLAIGAWENPARLQISGDYGVGEAVEAYKRACIAHQWEIPKDFDQMAYSEDNLPLRKR